MSARLNRLRQIFDDVLFVPASGGRGVVPTPRALELRDNLTNALGSLRGMLRDANGFDPTTSRRTFVIAIPEQPAAVLVPHLVRTILREAPAVRVSFLYPPTDVVARLEDGTVDILVASADRDKRSLMARALLEDDLLTAQREDHPRGRGTLDLDAFCALDHLVVSTGGGSFTGFVDRSLAVLGRHRRVSLSIQSYGLAPIIVAGSDCVCTLPSRLLRRYADHLDLFEPPLDLPTPRLIAMWHARSQADAGHTWLRDRLYQAAGRTSLGG